MKTVIDSRKIVEKRKELQPQSIKVLNWLLKLWESNQLPSKKGDIDRKIAKLMGMEPDKGSDRIRKQFQLICDQLEIPSDINGLSVNRRDQLHNILEESLELQDFLKEANNIYHKTRQYPPDITKATRKKQNIPNHPSHKGRGDSVDNKIRRLAEKEQPILKNDNYTYSIAPESTESAFSPSLDSSLKEFSENLYYNLRNFLGELASHFSQDSYIFNDTESEEFQIQGDLKYKKTFIKNWWQVDKGNEKVINYLNDLIDNGDKFTCIEAASSLCEIDPSNEKAFNILIEATESDDDKICRLAAKRLGDVGLSKTKTIEALINLSNNSRQPKTQIAVFETLGKIGRGYPTVIKFFDNFYENFLREDNLNNNSVISEHNPSQENDFETPIKNENIGHEDDTEKGGVLDLSENPKFEDNINIKDDKFNISIEKLEEEQQDGEIEIKIKLLPHDEKNHLPPNLQLIILDQFKNRCSQSKPQRGKIMTIVPLKKGHYSIQVVMEEQPKPIYEKYFSI